MGLAYIEQPVARKDLAGMNRVRTAANGIPVMADESLFTIHDAHALIQANAVDAFCIKLYKIGGITPAKKIAAIAEAGNVMLNCGGLAVQSQLEAAAGAHFYASIPEKRMMGAGEFLFGLNTTAPDPLVSETEFVVKNGRVNVPTGHGLGVNINDDLLKKYTLLHEVIK